jgi:PAS domain S-box-containing protein
MNNPQSNEGDYSPQDEVTLWVRRLQQERDFNAAILDHADLLILALDEVGRIVRFNRACETLTGRRFEDVAQLPLWDVLNAPEHSMAPAFSPLLEVSPPLPTLIETQCLAADGSTRNVEWKFSVIGNAGGFVGVGRDVTVERRTLQAQRQWEKHFELIFQSSPVPISIATFDEGRILLANDAFISLFGYTREELIGRTCDELGLWRNPQDRNAMKHLLLTQGSLRNFTTQGRTAQGKPLQLLASFESIEMNGAHCHLSVLADVTEHYLLEENLRLLSEGIAVSGTGGFFADAVRQLCLVLGVECALAGELLPDAPERVRTVAVFNRGESQANFEYELAGTPCEFLFSRSICVYEANVQTEFPDDHLLAVMHAQSYIGVPLYSSSGRAIGLLALIDNKPIQNSVYAASVLRVFATRAAAELERLHAEVALQHANKALEEANAALEARVAERTAQLGESEECLRQFAENVSQVFYLRPCQKGKLIYINSAFEKVWGYPRRVLDEQPDFWIETVLPEDLAHLRQMEGQHQAADDFDVEYRIRRADGEVRWIRDRIFPVRNAQGEVYRYAGIAEDVTERHQIEETLRAAHLAAEKANRAKSEFLSRMSHELRTPLNAILGFAQLLELDAQGDEERESIEHILRGGRQLLQMIDEVLDIARVESGHLNLSVEAVNLRDVISRCLTQAQAMAQAHNVTLRCPMPEEGQAPYLLGDEQRLQQVIKNLLSNAIKYNRAGGEVLVTCESAPGGRLRVNVGDTGPGIARENQARLFMPFERLGAEGSEIPGSGLGLALCKRLVEAMGGTIGVESAPGQGSTFWFVLPRVQPLPQLSDAVSPVAARSLAQTVLYIEDNVSNMRLMERLLSSRPQLRLVGARSGLEGLQFLESELPDLVLLDIQLPDVQGDEILRLLKANPRTRDVPVIVISADAIEAHIERLRAAGAADYLTKPLDLQRCLDVVDAWLKHKVEG